MSTQEQNTLFASQMISALVTLGCKHFAICPGSRSTPLTIAVARNPNAESYVFHDERSAAFLFWVSESPNSLGLLLPHQELLLPMLFQQLWKHQILTFRC